MPSPPCAGLKQLDLYDDAFDVSLWKQARTSSIAAYQEASTPSLRRFMVDDPVTPAPASASHTSDSVIANLIRYGAWNEWSTARRHAPIPQSLSEFKGFLHVTAGPFVESIVITASRRIAWLSANGRHLHVNASAKELSVLRDWFHRHFDIKWSSAYGWSVYLKPGRIMFGTDIYFPYIGDIWLRPYSEINPPNNRILEIGDNHFILGTSHWSTYLDTDWDNSDFGFDTGDNQCYATASLCRLRPGRLIRGGQRVTLDYGSRDNWSFPDPSASPSSSPSHPRRSSRLRPSGDHTPFTPIPFTAARMVHTSSSIVDQPLSLHSDQVLDAMVRQLEHDYPLPDNDCDDSLLVSDSACIGIGSAFNDLRLLAYATDVVMNPDDSIAVADGHNTVVEAKCGRLPFIGPVQFSTALSNNLVNEQQLLRLNDLVLQRDHIACVFRDRTTSIIVLIAPMTPGVGYTFTWRDTRRALVIKHQLAQSTSANAVSTAPVNTSSDSLAISDLTPSDQAPSPPAPLNTAIVPSSPTRTPAPLPYTYRPPPDARPIVLNANDRKRAKQAWFLHSTAGGHASDLIFGRLLDSGRLANCDLTSRDLANGRFLYGKCRACLIGKMRAPPVTSSKYHRTFDPSKGLIIAIDILTFRGTTHGNNKFGLVRVTVGSGYGTMSCIPSKDLPHLLEALQDTIIHLNTYGHVIQAFACDSESVLIATTDWCNQRKIQVHVSIPGEHQSHAEAFIRTLRAQYRVVEAAQRFLAPDSLEAEVLCGCIMQLRCIPNTLLGDMTPWEYITRERPPAHNVPLLQPGIFYNKRARTRASYGVVVSYDWFGPIKKLRVYCGETGHVLLRSLKFDPLDDVPADWNWPRRPAPPVEQFTDIEGRLTLPEPNDEETTTEDPSLFDTAVHVNPNLAPVQPVVQPVTQPLVQPALLIGNPEAQQYQNQYQQAMDNRTSPNPVPSMTSPLSVLPEGDVSRGIRRDAPPPKPSKPKKRAKPSPPIPSPFVSPSTTLSTPFPQLATDTQPPPVPSPPVSSDSKAVPVSTNSKADHPVSDSKAVVPTISDSKAIAYYTTRSDSKAVISIPSTESKPITVTVPSTASTVISRRQRSSQAPIDPPLPTRQSTRIRTQSQPDYNSLHRIGARAVKVGIIDPNRVSYKQGLDSEWRDLCTAAQQKEFINIYVTNKAFRPVHRRNIPQAYQTKIATCFMFFKLKGPDGAYTEAKGRFVWGEQKDAETVDSFKTHAPTANPIITHIVLYISAHEDRELLCADFPGAFLIPNIDPTVDEPHYGVIRGPLAIAFCNAFPELREFFDAKNTALYLQLTKYLYGTTEAAQKWYQYILTTVIPAIGFEPTDADKCLFRQRRPDGSYNFILSHVDDFLMSMKTPEEAQATLSILQDKWKVTSQTGDSLKYLGMILERDRPRRLIHVSMPAIISKLLTMFSEESTPARYLPAPQELFEVNSETNTSESVPSKPFMSALMTALYPARFYRFDILLTVNVLASAMSKPTIDHVKILMILIGYLRHTRHYRLALGGQGPPSLDLATDAGHGSHPDGKAQACLTILVGLSVAFMCVWKLKHQTLSSWESEMSAASEAGKMAVFLYRLRRDLNLPFQDEPILLYQDNQSAIYSNNSGLASFKRAKHINLREIYLTDLIKQKILKLRYIPTEYMMADLGTKVHPLDRFNFLLKLFNIG